MDELNSKKKSPEEPPVQEVPPTVNTDFINEKIKQRPLNRKRLTRRMIITACMAVLFGLIACVSFLVLEPVINNALYPPEKTEPVTFPEETQQEEMSPSEMIVDDNEMTTEEESAPTVDRSVIEQEVKRVLAAQTQDVSGYQRTYTSLKNVAQDAGKAMVTVTGVNSDVDWFNDPYESSGKRAV